MAAVRFLLRRYPIVYDAEPFHAFTSSLKELDPIQCPVRLQHSDNSSQAGGVAIAVVPISSANANEECYG